MITNEVGKEAVRWASERAHISPAVSPVLALSFAAHSVLPLVDEIMAKGCHSRHSVTSIDCLQN